MASANATITFEIEPIVKLTCSAFDCVHNLAKDPAVKGAYCNLKMLFINEDGTCAKKQLRTPALELRGTKFTCPSCGTEVVDQWVLKAHKDSVIRCRICKSKYVLLEEPGETITAEILAKKQ